MSPEPLNSNGPQPKKVKKFDYYKHMKEKKARESEPGFGAISI